MTQSADSTPKLIIFSILAGILLLVIVAFAFSKPEVVTLPVKFEEFTDFQCPACAQYEPVVQKILSEYSTDNISYEFRNFPLTTIHENAYQSALAAQAAKIQGKFTQYGETLFNNQTKLLRADLIGYATTLGLDTVKFTADMDSATVKAIVDADIAEGNRRGINATPTFFINGRKVVFKDTDNPEEVLRSLLNEKIALAIKQKGTQK